jgi:dihydroorotate dehydrogenase
VAFLASSSLPFLRQLEPEAAHAAASAALRWGLAGRSSSADSPSLAIDFRGLHFDNPVGLAAGFDKSAEALLPLSRLGFGFLETGTVTPLPQFGNERPRLFRLKEDRAIINRMGFNNPGASVVASRLSRTSGLSIPIGVNVGVNRLGARPVRDYPALISGFSDFASYVVVNVSSPNTPHLRDLQGEHQLQSLLRAISSERTRLPVFVKIAPDLSEDWLKAVVDTCLREAAAGLVVSNTSTDRPGWLRSPQAGERGGLSGPPLFPKSTRLLARAFQLSRGKLHLIAVGGVCSGTSALVKIMSGASLVQLYTAFAFRGPNIVQTIKTELASALREGQFQRLQDAVGIKAEEVCAS